MKIDYRKPGSITLLRGKRIFLVLVDRAFLAELIPYLISRKNNENSFPGSGKTSFSGMLSEISLIFILAIFYNYFKSPHRLLKTEYLPVTRLLIVRHYRIDLDIIIDPEYINLFAFYSYFIKILVSFYIISPII